MICLVFMQHMADNFNNSVLNLTTFRDRNYLKNKGRNITNYFDQVIFV